MALPHSSSTSPHISKACSLPFFPEWQKHEQRLRCFPVPIPAHSPGLTATTNSAARDRKKPRGSKGGRAVMHAAVAPLGHRRPHRACLEAAIPTQHVSRHPGTPSTKAASAQALLCTGLQVASSDLDISLLLGLDPDQSVSGTSQKCPRRELESPDILELSPPMMI